MYRIIVLVWLVGSFVSCKSQNDLSKSDSLVQFDDQLLVLEDVEYVAIDKLKNVYIVDRLHTLKKLDVNYKAQYEYSNRKLGDIVHVDVTNPLQLLVYYADFQIVKILDVTLSETNTYDLTELDLTDVQALGTSNDNGIWLYDETSARLKKLNAKGELVIESDRLDLLISNQFISPTQVIERDNLVFVYDPQYGIIVFDNFAQFNFISKDLLGGSLQSYGKFIIHHNQNGLRIWDPTYRTIGPSALGKDHVGADQAIYADDKILLRYGTKIYAVPTKN